MKRTRIVMQAFLLGSSLLAFLSPVDAQDVSINVVSDTTWTVIDSKGNFLGNAQQVCLATNSPSNCPGPANATLFNSGSSNQIWATIPGANWIWAPGITGATLNADNAEFFFQRTFVLCGTPQPGTISLSADNSAEVFINGGTAVVTSPVTTTNGQPGWSVVTTATVPASKFLSSPNLNTIVIHAKNAPTNCSPDTYQCNPAGVVFGASFADALSSWPTCTGNQTNPNDVGQIFNVGQTQAVACPPGQVGSLSQACGCINLAGQSFGAWGPTQGSCITACTGNQTNPNDIGQIFNVGQTQAVACPPGQVGSQSETCQPDGTWSSPSGTCQATCIGDQPSDKGVVFNVGQTQTVACPISGQVGPLSETCQADGTWSSPSGTCSCPAPSVLCFNGQTGANVCFTPLGGLTDNSGVFHAWCKEEDQNLEMDCSSSCPAGAPCASPIETGITSTESYCGDGNISTGTGGGSDAALLTFLALMAVWSIAGVWRLRRRASR